MRLSDIPPIVNVYYDKKDKELKCYDPELITEGDKDLRFIREDYIFEELVRRGYQITITRPAPLTLNNNEKENEHLHT